MRNYLRDLILAMADAKVDFVIAGGVAAVLHGVERVTMDLDVSLKMTPENIARFLTVMKNQSMTPRVPVPAEVLLDNRQVSRIVNEKNAVVFTFVDVDVPLKHVDVFLREHLGYDLLASDAVTIELGGRSVQVASKQRLIALKRQVTPPRQKDLWDISELEKLG